MDLNLGLSQVFNTVYLHASVVEHRKRLIDLKLRRQNDGAGKAHFVATLAFFCAAYVHKASAFELVSPIALLKS